MQPRQKRSITPKQPRSARNWLTHLPAAKTVRQGWKDSGQLKEHKDTWNQVRELKDDITEVQVSYTEASGQARLLKAQAKNDVKDGKYDEAIAKLKQKKKALSSMEQINGIWAQIDSLLK